jgi:hypothetical protein
VVLKAKSQKAKAKRQKARAKNNNEALCQRKKTVSDTKRRKAKGESQKKSKIFVTVKKQSY